MHSYKQYNTIPEKSSHLQCGTVVKFRLTAEVTTHKCTGHLSRYRLHV